MSKKVSSELQNEDSSISGFNLGFDVGKEAGM
jgi:hypothetical protein